MNYRSRTQKKSVCIYTRNIFLTGFIKKSISAGIEIEPGA